MGPYFLLSSHGLVHFGALHIVGHKCQCLLQRLFPSMSTMALLGTWDGVGLGNQGSHAHPFSYDVKAPVYAVLPEGTPVVESKYNAHEEACWRCCFLLLSPLLLPLSLSLPSLSCNLLSSFVFLPCLFTILFFSSLFFFWFWFATAVCNHAHVVAADAQLAGISTMVLRAEVISPFHLPARD